MALPKEKIGAQHFGHILILTKSSLTVGTYLSHNNLMINEVFASEYSLFKTQRRLYTPHNIFMAILSVIVMLGVIAQVRKMSCAISRTRTFIFVKI
jgi:hypothetical protein